MLWTLVGQTWRFPVASEASSGTDILKVNLSPIPTLAKQRLAVESFLTARSVNQNEQGWFLLRNTLAECALISDGKDPEDCVSWTPPLEGEKEEDQFQGMDGFFERLSSAGWGTVPALKTFYYKFSLAMLEQLVVRKEPVDLIWAKIHHLPFRVNWKQVLMEMDMERAPEKERRIRWRNNRHKTRRWPSVDMKDIKQRGVPEMLLETYLQGCRWPDKLMSSTVEIELTPLFHKNYEATERRKMTPGLLRRIGDEIHEKTDTILKLYQAFCKASEVSWVRLVSLKLPKSQIKPSEPKIDRADRPWDLGTTYGVVSPVDGSLIDSDVTAVENSTEQTPRTGG